MTYLDGTEEPPDRTKPPSRCPLCRSKLTTRWSATIQHKRGWGYVAIAVPAHVCAKCQVAVRVCTLPRRTLYATRKAARESAEQELALRNEKLASLGLRRGAL